MTVTEQLAALPAILTADVTITVTADEAAPIAITRFLSAGGTLRIDGQGRTVGPLTISGPVSVVLDNLTVHGGPTAVRATHGARLAWTTLVLRGWSTSGLFLGYGAFGTFAGPGTLDVKGTTYLAGWGVHIVDAMLAIWNTQSNCHVRSEWSLNGFALGFGGYYTHQGPAGSTTIKVCRDALVLATDHSTWSTDQMLVGDSSDRRYRINSLAYFEATGPKTWNLVGPPSVSTGAVAYVP
jgi:hypothetical protein